MKKVFACFACMALAVTFSLSVTAASIDANEQKVLDAVSTSISVDGKTVSLPDTYITQVENYLKRDDVTITAEQAEQVVAQVNKAIDVVKKSGVSSLSALTGSQKTEILGIAQTAANVVDLKVSLNSTTNVITVLDSDGQVVASLESAIKVTGGDLTSVFAVIGIALILLVGCAVVARKSKLFVK